MSFEKFTDRTDPNFEGKLSQDNFQQFVESAENMSFLSSAKVSGVGDIPDLISDETPPASMLEIASDSDVLSASSRNELFMEGESNEGADAKLISAKSEEIKSLQSSVDLSGTDAPVSAKIKIFERANLVNNNCVQKFSNMGQTELTGEEISEPEEKGCAVPVNGSEFHEISQAMAKNVALPGPSESGAVNAPDPEAQVMSVKEEYDEESHEPAILPAAQQSAKTSERTLSPPPSTSPSETEAREEVPSLFNVPIQEYYAISTSQLQQPNKTSKNNNICKGNGACELVSKEQKQSPLHSPQRHSLAKSIEDSRLASQSKSERKNYFAAKTASLRGARVWRESRSPGTRRLSRSRSKSREERSKSPGRVVVEVYDRKVPVAIRSADGKPVSPYLCKVFPVKRSSKPGRSFEVNENQNRLLDEELHRALERERLLLFNAMNEYFRSRKPSLVLPKPGQRPNSPGGGGGGNGAGQTEDNEIDPPMRETYMSWIINEKHRGSEKEGERYWNPLANIFRKSRSTQVSNKSSLYDSAKKQDQEESAPPPLLTSYSHATMELAKTIHIVGQEQEDAIYTNAQEMYQALKIVQKAIHLSDLFCFRNTVPEMALGESLNQPEFQQFMESGNEIEILVNLMSILGTARDNIQLYLNSIQEANLITEKDSGLTKIGMKSTDNGNGSNGSIPSLSLEDMDGEKEKVGSHIPVTCPSCQSQINVRLGNQLSADRMLPTVHTFLEEQRNVTLSSYIRKDDNGRNRLLHIVMFNGHKYQIQFASCSAETSGGIQGVMTATIEYVGEPTYTSLESLLGAIHRCTSYMDTRITCSCVWARQSKRFLLEIIEKYLKKEYRPSTEQGWWGLRRMEGKLRQFNVFAGIIRSFCDELVESANILHFCMLKTLELLNKKLRDTRLPGFTEVNLNSDEEDNRGRSDKHGQSRAYAYRKSDINENGVSASVEVLYYKLKDELAAEENSLMHSDDTALIGTLLKMAVLAVKDINETAALGVAYSSHFKMPNKRSRRVLRFMNATLAQLGLSKDVEFGALMAAFLAAVDKLSVFDEFMCEQRVEIRAKVNLICQQIIEKLVDLRSLLMMQRVWSANLARNSFMRIKEINEIRRLRRLKKKERHIMEKLQLLRGSDKSLTEVLEQ